MSDIKNLLNDSGYNFFFLVVDKFLNISLPELTNFQSIFENKLKVKNSGYLLSLPHIQDKIKSSQNPVIIPFKPSAKIELICQKNQWLNASNSSKINRLLEDKIKFHQLCEQNNIPIIPSLIAPFNQESFEKAQKKFGKNLVIQTHFGWAGNSTHNSDNYNHLKNTIPKNTQTKFSPYLKGYSLLNNCCLTQHGLIQSPPALQYTGLENLTQNRFATVGRQWPSMAPPKIQDKIYQLTSDFSEKILKPLNYRGFFGLDFIVFEEKVYLLECNPRLTASFAFYTKIEQKNQITPLFYYHLAEFININYPLDIEKEQKRFYNQNIIGSELVKRNNQGLSIRKYNSFEKYCDQVDPIIIKSQILSKL